jgi:methylase of polypeptide subunit release factors
LTLDNGDLLNTADCALVELLRYLVDQHYDFTTPTPVTHEIVTQRVQGRTRVSLADVLGWNFPFMRGSIDPNVERFLARANAVSVMPGGNRSLVRVAKLQDDLFLHSGFPTAENDAVFFGPDSYRFANLIDRDLRDLPLAVGARIVDIGTGSGVGAVVAARLHPLARVAMTDINAKALRMAIINTKAADVKVDALLGPELAGLSGQVDVALANPPYIIDAAQRLYRDGGGSLGGDVSVRIARAVIDRLSPGGRLILYTGSAISHGVDHFKQEMTDLADTVGASLRYREIDPDVFGEELRGDAYAEVDRIAVVAAVIDMPGIR